MSEERATIQFCQVSSTVKVECPATQTEYMRQLARILMNIFTRMPPEDRNPYEAPVATESC